jgi:hypothetical protein
MKPVISVRGADERMHIFRLERPGRWVHYVRKVWEHTEAAEERAEYPEREYTSQEITMWIESQYPPDPILPEEIRSLAKTLPNNLGNGGGGENKGC